MGVTRARWYVMSVVTGTLFGLLLLTLACSTTGSNSGGQEVATSTPSEGPVTVNIEAGDFYIKPSQDTFKVGVPYHFVVTNVGKVPHEIMLMPVVQPSSGITMTEMDKMALGLVEEEDLPAGATATFDVTFTKPYGPGELELACHIAGHYEAGMHTPITVVGTATGSNSSGQEGATSTPSGSPVTVNVEAGELYIKTSQDTFKVGVPYHFVVTNVGKAPHEIMLMPVVKPSSGISMTEMDKMAMGMVEEEDFPAGATATFDVTFSKPYGPGELELACHIAGHYEGGMHTPITVVAQ